MVGIESWRPFPCKKLFEVKNTKSVLLRDIKEGSTPFVTASKFNNGVLTYIDASKYDTIRGHCILIGGKTFTVTYQKDNFVSNDSHNYTIRSFENIGELEYLYLVSVIYAYFGQKYSWSAPLTKTMFLNENITLPSTPDNQPDWIYMKSYMKQIVKNSEKSLKSLSRINDAKRPVNTDEWGRFRIGDLFNVVKGSRLTKANMKDGGIRFVGSSSANNGETHRISNNEHLHPANTITVCYNGSVGETFYQDEEFWASDDVNVLYPKFKMSKYAALFICPIIKAIGQKYAFVNKWKQEDMKNAVIKLPITQTGQPDWQYMKKYMKSVINKSEQAINNIYAKTSIIDAKNAENW